MRAARVTPSTSHTAQQVTVTRHEAQKRAPEFTQECFWCDGTGSARRQRLVAGGGVAGAVVAVDVGEAGTGRGVGAGAEGVGAALVSVGAGGYQGGPHSLR